MVLRNEVVIFLARCGLDEFWTRVSIYGIGWLTFVAGSHFNEWCFSRHWRFGMRLHAWWTLWR
jgi:hypothetical protein